MNRANRKSVGGVTVQEVARDAGVSAMTVSRVMNGVANVREATRERVLASVERLNYLPNVAARSLAAGSAAPIGLLYGNPSDTYLSRFLIGALEGARRGGCHLMVAPCADAGEAGAIEAARQFGEAQARGAILPPPLSESATVRAELRAAGIAFVTVAGSGDGDSLGNVGIDDRRAAFELTQYLLELGHRRVAFINGPADHRASVERLAGFAAAMVESGIDRKMLRVEQGEFTYASGVSAAGRLLDHDPPTAIFAANDDMAAAAVGVAHRMGLDVPRDISIVGFDDTAIATNIWPALTTVRQPIAAMAQAAVDMLLRRLPDTAGPATGEQIVLGHELVLRESAGPAPG